MFGTGGGSLMSRLTGEGKLIDAKKVCSYSVALSAITAAIFSVAVFIFMDPVLIPALYDDRIGIHPVRLH